MKRPVAVLLVLSLLLGALGMAWNAQAAEDWSI